MKYLKLFLEEKLTIFKAKLNGHMNRVLTNGKQYMKEKLNLTDDEIECLIKIKDKKVNEFTAFSEGKFQKLKEEVLANPMAATVLGGVSAVKDRAAALFNSHLSNTPAASPPLEISSAAGTSKQIIPAQASNAVNAAKENAAALAAAAKERATQFADKLPKLSFKSLWS